MFKRLAYHVQKTGLEVASWRKVYVPFIHEKGERKLEKKKKQRIPKRNLNMRETLRE